jgi:PAS domain S-box-containing protein
MHRTARSYDQIRPLALTKFRLPAPIRTAHMPEFSQATDRRIDNHKWVWIIGVLLVAIMAGFQVYDVLKRRSIVMDTTERTYASLARSLAEQTQRIVQAADLAVSDTVRDVSLIGSRGTLLSERLRERVAAFPQLQGLLVLGVDGRSLAAAGAPQPQAVTDQTYFTLHRAKSSVATYVSSAFRRQDNGRWTIALSRRITRSDGGLRGVAVAFLDLDYVSRVYGSVDLGAGSEISLFHADGHLLARFPDSQREIGRSFSEQPVYRQLLSGNETDTIVGQAELDRRNVTYAIQPLAGFPLRTFAAVDNSTVLKPWNVSAMHSAVRTTLFCVSVLLLLALVLRQLRHREQAEASLRVQTALLDELFETAPESIVMLDPEQRVTRVNREFTHMFGFSAEQARGRPLTDLIVPDDLKQEAHRMAEAVRESRHTSVETKRMRSNGGRLHVSELGAPIRGAGGNIASYAIYRDITERKLAEAERTKLETRLRQAEKLEAIGTMAGGIAHDFNSVLTAILRYGEMARNAAPEAGALKGYVSNVLSAANRARVLVDQILTYSRTTRGKHGVVNAGVVVEEALDLTRPSLPANVELKIELPATRATVIANPTQIHQLVTNLCSNAVHAMREGGTLSVALEIVDMAQDRELSHGLLAAGRYVRLTVQDTGCGIPSAVLDHIFEPFFTTKESGLGTGLGLALVQGIVSELGGAIDVQSRTGAGSAFHLYLPRSDADAIGTMEAVVSLPRGAGQRVLLVEDERPLMLLAEEMLAALGYEPAGFTRPSEALDEFRADPSRLDAVLVDYLMPEMTGVELTQHLRAVRADVPVVLMSGYEGPVLLQEAFAAGIDHIITKPLALQQLAEAMANALAQISVR